MSQEPIEELDFERYGQWVRAEHPDGDVIEGSLEVPCHFGDCVAIRLHPLEGPPIEQPARLQRLGYVFTRIPEPHEAAYRRGYRDGLNAAREMIDTEATP